MNCIRFTRLCRAVPFSGLRLRLCQWHVERCQLCQQESASAVMLPPLLVTVAQLPPDLDLWPGVRAGITGSAAGLTGPEVLRKQKNRIRRWAYAASMALLLLAAGIWVVFRQPQMGTLPGPVASRPAVRTHLCSARIENHPARIFQVQSRNPNRAIFWIAKNNNRS